MKLVTEFVERGSEGPNKTPAVTKVEAAQPGLPSVAPPPHPQESNRMGLKLTSAVLTRFSIGTSFQKFRRILGDEQLAATPIAEALLTATFLILLAASAAVVISMGALALFDLAFGKRKPSAVVEEKESSQLEAEGSQLEPEPPRTEAKLKPKHFVADRPRSRAERTTGYGPESQRVRHHH